LQCEVQERHRERGRVRDTLLRSYSVEEGEGSGQGHHYSTLLAHVAPVSQASQGPQLPKELPSLEKEGVRTHLSNRYRHCPRQPHNAHGNSVVNRSPRPPPTTTRPLSSSALSISSSATCANPLDPGPALSAANPSTILLERSFLELTCPSVNLPSHFRELFNRAQ
jgi:hypothetical protein